MDDLAPHRVCIHDLFTPNLLGNAITTKEVAGTSGHSATSPRVSICLSCVDSLERNGQIDQAVLNELPVGCKYSCSSQARYA